MKDKWLFGESVKLITRDKRNKKMSKAFLIVNNQYLSLFFGQKKKKIMFIYIYTYLSPFRVDMNNTNRKINQPFVKTS